MLYKMSCCLKNKWFALVALLLLIAFPQFLNNTGCLFFCAKGNTEDKSCAAAYTFSDAVEEKQEIKWLFLFLSRGHQPLLFLVILSLPISFYLIKFLTKSSRTPRLPPFYNIVGNYLGVRHNLEFWLEFKEQESY